MALGCFYMCLQSQEVRSRVQDLRTRTAMAFQSLPKYDREVDQAEELRMGKVKEARGRQTAYESCAAYS